MSAADIDKLTRNIIAGLLGAEEGYTSISSAHAGG